MASSLEYATILSSDDYKQIQGLTPYKTLETV